MRTRNKSYIGGMLASLGLVSAIGGLSLMTNNSLEPRIIQEYHYNEEQISQRRTYINYGSALSVASLAFLLTGFGFLVSYREDVERNKQVRLTGEEEREGFSSLQKELERGRNLEEQIIHSQIAEHDHRFGYHDNDHCGHEH